ncbi:MAG: ABC transporter substrate-binding protein [Segniliparus sp.]|uniref:ABC transporter substrate-binding protein n=1 Tax=Segniliparus sp. TaxID=2804064 RepID=UPI003F319059
MTATPRRALLRACAGLALLAAALPLTSCTIPTAAVRGADGKAVIRYQGWPGTVLWQELAADLGYFQKVSIQWVGSTTSGPQDIQSVATDQVDVGQAFDGAVVKLVAAKAKVQSVITYYGADAAMPNTAYVVLDDSPIREPRDLVGKSIALNTLGAHSEMVLREWLFRQGISEGEAGKLTEVVVPPVSQETALRNHQVQVAALSGGFLIAAEKRGGLRRVFSDQSLFGPFGYGVQVFRKGYIQANQDVLKDYVQGVARALAWAQARTPDEVRAKFLDIIHRRHRAESTEAVQYYLSSTVPAQGGVMRSREFQVWIDRLVRTGKLAPGQVKAEDAYTNEFNPYSAGEGQGATL